MFRFYCHGGPWDGVTLMLASPTTLVFTAKGMTGRYRGGSAHYWCQRGELFHAYSNASLEKRYGHDLIWEETNV